MTENHKAGMDERAKRLKARDEHIRSLTPKRPLIHVEPTKDDYRKYLKHPNGTPFPQDSGTAEWPHDRFTKRRIADGSIKAVEKQSEPSRSPPQRQHRTTEPAAG